VHLAPNAQVSLYPWKDTAHKIPLAVRISAPFSAPIDLLQQRNLWQPPPSSARCFVPASPGARHGGPRASRRATTAMGIFTHTPRP
jgi:hypothetical protein